MKKTKLLSLIFILSFLGLSTLVLLNANVTTIKATVQASPLDPPVQQASSLANVTVDQIDHTVKILQAGSIVINDTLRLSAKLNNTVTLANYSLGFPYGYKSSLANVYAFNASNPLQTLNVSLDTGLGTSIGFYGVTVIFPRPGVYLSNDESFSFTVVYVFSNVMTSSTYTYYNPELTKPANVTAPVLTMYFPFYPSLPQNATVANVTVICPPNTEYEDSAPSLEFKNTSSVTGQILNTTTRSLGAFAYSPAWLNFTNSATGAYSIVTFDNVARQVQIDGLGNIFITDTYTITSQMQQAADGFELNLLRGARNVSAFDAQTGASMTAPVLVNVNTTTYNVNFGFSLQQGNSTQVKLTYYLSGNYLTKAGINDFNLNLPIAQGFDRVAGKLTLAVSLPEGASIKEYPNLNYDLQNGALQQEILFTAYNVSSFSNLNMHMTYVYFVFWASFSPTLWMTAISAIGVGIALLWQRPKPSLPSRTHGVAVKPQTLKSIVSSYEERTRILRELESIERQTQKGKLPRRRYKIHKRMLESQLARLDRELVDLKQRVKSVGPKYTEILKDLDIAEAELEGVEAEVKRVEARYRSSAISLDSYRRLQDQLNKRREKAKTTIDGTLLRLSEGTA